MRAPTVARTDVPDAGAVAELWRYPVKSLQGEAVPVLELAPGGVAGDRAWGVVDRATGRVLSAKTVPALLDAAATLARDGRGGVRIVLPDGTDVTSADGDGADRVLSGWLDRDVALRPAAVLGPTAYQMTFDPPNDDAALVDIETPGNAFVDLADVHLLSTGSLAALVAHAPDLVWPARRFRPNVLVATGDTADGAAGDTGDTAETDDYPEDGWVGRAVALGTAELRVLMRTVRCAVPLRAQPALGDRPALPRDVSLYRTLATHHDNHLGVYAAVAVAGTVRLGDRAALV